MIVRYRKEDLTAAQDNISINRSPKRIGIAVLALSAGLLSGLAFDMGARAATVSKVCFERADEAQTLPEIAEDINDIAETAAELSDAETLGESFIVVSSDGEGIDTELTLARANAIKAQDIRSQLVAYAKQFVGGRYRYGGTSLQNGVDCSGFVMNIFGHFGISTGRDSRTQAANSRAISLSEIQPGDLLFYSSGGRIDHVAIYIGDGLIVHAANAKKGITISNMYYRTPVKAGRFL